ncbi:MAG TPA: hypothetical protein VGA50_17650 [Kiloniellales bacterium]|jgi:hypothetical protein
MARVIQLPKWAAIDPNNPRRVIVDSAAAYPAWLEELGVGEARLDKYWLEVAYQAIKLDIQAAMGPGGLEIKMTRAAKFAQKTYRPGRGTARASQGKEARGHYARIRGFLPA